MALFRFYRGGLAESLLTTVIIKSTEELKELLTAPIFLAPPGRIVKIETEPYPDSKNNFDARIGWYTQLVIVHYEGGVTDLMGCLSEPLNS